jgi:hypothetical protein
LFLYNIIKADTKANPNKTMNIVNDLQTRYNDLSTRYADLLSRYRDIYAIEESQLVVVRDEQEQIITELNELWMKLGLQRKIEKVRTRVSKSYLAKDVSECTVCDDWECPICFEKKKDVSLMKTPCGHVFCDDCKMQLKKVGPSSCPLCRASFFIDTEPVITDAQLFEKLAECRCCDRHQLGRPPTYAIWQPEVIDQEAWYERRGAEFNANERNRNCECTCRQFMRRLTLFIQ